MYTNLSAGFSNRRRDFTIRNFNVLISEIID